MSVIEKAQCKIDFINHKGLGIGRTKSGAVELPYTIPGEIVEFERHSYRNQTNCLLKSIVKPSKNRIKPQCKHFGVCGGCLLQHLNEKSYNQFKSDLIKQILSAANIKTNILPTIIIPPNNRRRINLQALKKNDKIYLGFYRFRSHQIINIEECPLSLPELSKLIQPLKEVLQQTLVDKQKAEIFLTKTSNGIDIKITTTEAKQPTSNQIRSLSNFVEQHNITVEASLNCCIIRLLFNDVNVLSNNLIPEIVFGNIAVEIDSDCFLQPSYLSDQILSKLILKHLNVDSLVTTATKSVVDLFCGRGTYTLPLSNYFKVDGFESDQNALKSLQKAVNKFTLPITLVQRDLFNAPLNNKELTKYDFAVINPPRAGAKAQCQSFKNSDIMKIVYISCNPYSFVNDTLILQQSGYKLVELAPIDQFYWSPHLEVIGFFSKVH